jgi:hypothetical protein
MPQIKTNGRRLAIAALIATLAGLALAACGSSSKSSSSSTSTSAGAATTITPPSTKGAATRFAEIRACLQKSGVALPTTPGQRPQPGGGGLLGAPLPKGVTRAQYLAALKKCGGQRGGSRLSNPNIKQGFVKFASCMREHGVKIGEPNTSGKGPIFNTTGINTNSAQFKKAEASCISRLRVSPGVAGEGAAGAAPAG